MSQDWRNYHKLLKFCPIFYPGNLSIAFNWAINVTISGEPEGMDIGDFGVY